MNHHWHLRTIENINQNLPTQIPPQKSLPIFLFEKGKNLNCLKNL